MIYARCAGLLVKNGWKRDKGFQRYKKDKLMKEKLMKKDPKRKTHSSHCSHHSTGLTAFSFTLVWYFSFPNAIVTNASFVPFFPFTFRPFAFFTEKEGR